MTQHLQTRQKLLDKVNKFFNSLINVSGGTGKISSDVSGIVTRDANKLIEALRNFEIQNNLDFSTLPNFSRISFLGSRQIQPTFNIDFEGVRAQILTDEQEGNIIEQEKKTSPLLIPAIIIGALILS